jgi:ABC-type transport system involved in multi-copper enzyme maturation permease subunit
MDNKGQVIDLLQLPMYLAGIIIGFLVLMLLANAIYPPLLTAGNQTTTEFGTHIMGIPNIIDSMGLGMVVAFSLIFIISAIVIKIHPVTFGIGLVVLIFAVWLGGGANNVVQTFVTTNNTMVNQTYTQATGLQLVSNNIVTIIIGVGALSLILSYLIFRRNEGDVNAL